MTHNENAEGGYVVDDWTVPRSWLVNSAADRERLVDMDRRLRPVRRQTFLVLAVALLAASWWVGLWTLVPLLLAAGVFRLAENRVEGAAHPEFWMLGAWLGAEAIIALSLALTGDAAVSLLALLAIPVVTLSARFSPQGVWLGVGVVVALMIAVAFGTNAGVVADDPPLLIVPIAVAVAVALLSTALMRSDVEHRDKAIIDPLTGLPNRNLLGTHIDELEQRSEFTRDPVAVIHVDLDGFKVVNDSHGHAAGDGVLIVVAQAMQDTLRSFDRLYRMGGDEFLILIPGGDLDDARIVAHKVRSAVGAVEIDPGVRVSLSCGVSASFGGEAFCFELVFAVADAALLEAKRGGGGVICVPSMHTTSYGRGDSAIAGQDGRGVTEWRGTGPTKR